MIKYLQWFSPQNYAWFLNCICTKISYSNELENIKDFSNLHLKTFSNLYTFLAFDLVLCVTSQEDMRDNHFLPLVHPR